MASTCSMSLRRASASATAAVADFRDQRQETGAEAPGQMRAQRRVDRRIAEQQPALEFGHIDVDLVFEVIGSALTNCLTRFEEKRSSCSTRETSL